MFGCVFTGCTGRRVPCLVTCWDDFIECTDTLYLVWLLVNEKVAAPMNGFGEVTTSGKQTEKTMNSTHTQIRKYSLASVEFVSHLTTIIGIRKVLDTLAATSGKKNTQADQYNGHANSNCK